MSGISHEKLDARDKGDAVLGNEQDLPIICHCELLKSHFLGNDIDLVVVEEGMVARIRDDCMSGLRGGGDADEAILERQSNYIGESSWLIFL